VGSRQALREQAGREGKDTRWTQEERDGMTFAFRVLGRLGLESDADLSPLYDDPRWAELLRGLGAAQDK